MTTVRNASFPEDQDFPTRTLARDLALRLAIVLTIIIVALGSAYFFITVSQARSELLLQATNRVEELSNVLSIPVWNLDKNSIEQICQAYLQAENVVGVRVLDDTGDSIYEKPTDEANLIVETRPIEFNGQQVGSVEVSVSTRQIDNLRSNIFLLMLSIVIVVVVTILISTWFLLQRFLSQPLSVLTMGIESFASGDYSQRLKPMEQKELNIISEQFNAMANQIQARDQLLEKRVADRTRDLSIASSVSRQITRVLDMDELLHQLVAQTKEGFNLYAASVYIYQPEARELTLEATTGEETRQMTKAVKTLSIDARPSLVAQGAREQTQIVNNDVSESKDYLVDPSLPDAKSEAVFPMLVGARLIGVLDLLSEKTDRFSEADIQILTTLAEQIGIAVRNAQLYSVQLQASAELRRADQMKSQFLSSMSHELRTPLNAIINLDEMVARGMVGPVTDEQKELLEQSLVSSQHLLQLINDVLDISKIQAGQLKLFVENNVNLHDEINTVVIMVKPLLEKKPLELVQDIDSNLPIIAGDRRRLRQILVNLLSNAIKFTNQGAVTLSVRNQEDQIKFSVIDTGYGIPIESQAVIFEPFVQTLDGIKQEGTGLGLPITRSLVEAHGGELWMESEIGVGTAFHFTIPAENNGRMGEK
ncbi:MAG: GAF domain-containing protein [Chloroflexi bacterium]|nr:GAF domain-containing protein [Chloroflexota bacterium]